MRPDAGGSCHAPSLRPGAPGFAEAVTWLLGLPLDAFAGAGHLLEVRVPWHQVTLWLVPDEGAVQRLEAEGLSRGRIWTSQEVADLLSVPGIARESARMVALAKLGFDGVVTEVRTSGPERPRSGEPGALR